MGSYSRHFFIQKHLLNPRLTLTIACVVGAAVMRDRFYKNECAKKVKASRAQLAVDSSNWVVKRKADSATLHAPS
ncbi:hypothetical protein [Chroococcidiopsis sp. CCMEE 29]|uniref:hypothetical protein n=1 Tax=Chroococcidiopsis sp. CCMEE 29 TaxID=155894 RepID=UPI002021EB14|nr:hypothetical protein [Chroococcidiopsis sp. CCMEE 29]